MVALSEECCEVLISNMFRIYKELRMCYINTTCYNYYFHYTALRLPCSFGYQVAMISFTSMSEEFIKLLNIVWLHYNLFVISITRHSLFRVFYYVNTVQYLSRLGIKSFPLEVETNSPHIF